MVIEKFLIEPQKALLVVIDFQEKLANAMKKDVLESTLKNTLKLIHLCKIHDIPILFTEQYPKGLGQTLTEIKNLIDESAIEKIHFSCLNEEKFIEKIKQLSRNQVILVGMEAHVCVFQTALDFLIRDYRVFVPKDAVCSRRKDDWRVGIDLIKEAGGIITCTETIIFQILKKAGTPQFKAMLEFVK